MNEFKIYKLVPSGAENTDISVTPPVNKSFTQISIDYTAPGNGLSAVLIKWDNKIISAAQFCKYVGPGLSVTGNNVKKFEIVLDNKLGTVDAFLGVTFIYEEN